MKRLGHLFFAAVLAFAAMVASAQVGGKLVHMVVPFAAGGVQDILARSISAELGQALGTSVIVENRAGAGGTIGTAAVAKSAADGSTLILSAASHTINGSLYTKLAYDPIKDFTPIAHMGNVSYVLMISSAIPANSVAEFVKYAKANPGKLNYASAGNGSATHMSMAYFVRLAGLDMVHIPFKSTGEAVNEVMSGRAQAVIAANIGAIPYIKDARVKLIGVTGLKPSRFLPGIPAIAESGVPGYEFDSWFGLLGPAGIPRATVEQINDAVGKLLKDPAILERLAKQGIEPQTMSPDAFGNLLASNFEKMAKVVKISGARVD